jgi:hypothetical protein
VFRDPRGLDSRGFYMGTLDGRTPNGVIVSNSDNTISIFATNVDPASDQQSPAAKSRSNAIAANQLVSNQAISSNPGLMLPTGAYNAELVKPLSVEMQVKIRNYGNLIRQ